MVGSSVINAMFPLHAFQPLQYRHVAVTTLVVAAHAGVLWLAHTALQNRPAEVLIPAQVIMELAQAAPQPLPSPAPAPAPAPAPQQPAKNRTVQRPTPVPQPAKAELPAAVPAKEPSPIAPQGSPAESASQAASTPAPATQATPAVGTAAAPAPAAMPTVPPRVELPSTQATFLYKPDPPYPLLSNRLREEGTVILHVLIDTEGSVAKVEIRTSSGYHRLDQAALKGVLPWRFVPHKPNGVPTAAWYEIPVKFQLTDK